MLAKMDLPVEIWMRVFESLEPDDYMVVRSEGLLEYKKVHNEEQTHDECMIPAVEKEATSKLPAFEQRAWLRTRSFHEINRKSRAAAVRMRLSKRLLTNSWRACKMRLNTKYLESGPHAKKFVAPRSIDRLRSYAVVELRPVMAIEGPEEVLKYYLNDFSRGLKGGKWRLDYRHLDFRGYVFTDLLSESEHVVLLAPSAFCENKQPDWFYLHLAALAQEAVRQFWAEKGIRYRKVEVFNKVHSTSPDDPDPDSE